MPRGDDDAGMDWQLAVEPAELDVEPAEALELVETIELMEPMEPGEPMEPVEPDEPMGPLREKPSASNRVVRSGDGKGRRKVER